VVHYAIGCLIIAFVGARYAAFGIEGLHAIFGMGGGFHGGVSRDQFVQVTCFLASRHSNKARYRHRRFGGAVQLEFTWLPSPVVYIIKGGCLSVLSVSPPSQTFCLCFSLFQARLSDSYGHQARAVYWRVCHILQPQFG
jgi:hypothetical protein